jgi:hypothetical protein
VLKIPLCPDLPATPDFLFDSAAHLLYSFSLTGIYNEGRSEVSSKWLAFLQLLFLFICSAGNQTQDSFPESGNLKNNSKKWVL